MIFLIFIFIYIPSCYSSICISPIYPCLICSYTSYDTNYSPFSQLSGLLLQNTSCSPKNNNVQFTRKVLILNSSQIHASYVNTYDSIYMSLINALEQENDIIQGNLNGSIEFYLEEGDHYIIRNNISYSTIYI